MFQPLINAQKFGKTFAVVDTVDGAKGNSQA
jgi:hypothetical protein